MCVLYGHWVDYRCPDRVSLFARIVDFPQITSGCFRFRSIDPDSAIHRTLLLLMSLRASFPLSPVSVTGFPFPVPESAFIQRSFSTACMSKPRNLLNCAPFGANFWKPVFSLQYVTTPESALLAENINKVSLVSFLTFRLTGCRSIS